MLALANKKTHLKSDDTNIDLTSLKKDLENPIFNVSYYYLFVSLIKFNFFLRFRSEKNRAICI